MLWGKSYFIRLTAATLRFNLFPSPKLLKPIIMEKITLFVRVLVRSNSSPRFLLIRYNTGDDQPCWNFPGDFVADKANLVDAATASVYKQTDVRCRVANEIGCRFDSKSATEIHFMAADQIYGHAMAKQPQTIIEVKWCRKEEVEKLLPPELLPYEW